MAEHLLARHPLMLLLLVYWTLCFVTFFSWSGNRWYPVTGDEPHYLAIASGVINYGTFEQTRSYRDDFPDLPTFFHTFEGPNGRYNAHGIGLPLIVCVPYLIGGAAAAKISLILLSGFLVVLLWRVSSFYTTGHGRRFLIVLIATVSLPFITAANQLYPEIPAGLICLTAISWLLLMESDAERFRKWEWAVAIGISFLPWFHIKFLGTTLVLVFFLVINSYAINKSVGRIAAIVGPTFASLLLLGAYNYHAFGRLTGYFNFGEAIIGKVTLMVLIGVHLDQFQGVFIQNPTLFAALLFLIPFLRRNWMVGLTTLIVYASIVVPNSFHPSYGGRAFAGRFAWAAVVVAMPVVVFALSRLREDLGRKVYLLFGLLLLIQAVLYVQYTFRLLPLVTPRYAGRFLWLSEYPSFYPNLKSFLPAWLNLSWAFSYGPNIAFLILAGGLIAGGLFYLPDRRAFYRSVLVFLATCAAFVIGAGLTSTAPGPPKTFMASELPSRVGEIVGDTRMAQEGRHKAGFLTFGPYIDLAEGKYLLTLSYTGHSPEGTNLGWWDVFVQKPEKMRIMRGDIRTPDGPGVAVAVFSIPRQLSGARTEIRTYYNGVGLLSVKSLTIEKLR